MTITPQDIQNKEFREAFRGYNQDEVDGFLDDVAEDYEQLVQEIQRLRLQLSSVKAESRSAGPLPTIVNPPAAQPAPAAQAGVARTPQPAVLPSHSDERSAAREEMKRALVATQRAAEAALDEAKRRAAEIVARAEQRAKEIDEMTARRAKDVDIDAGSALTHAQQRVEELKRQEVELRARLRRMLNEHVKMLQQLEGDAIDARVPGGESSNREALWLTPREPAGASSQEVRPRQEEPPSESSTAPNPDASAQPRPSEDRSGDAHIRESRFDQPEKGQPSVVTRINEAFAEEPRVVVRGPDEPVPTNGAAGMSKRESFWRR